MYFLYKFSTFTKQGNVVDRSIFTVVKLLYLVTANPTTRFNSWCLMNCLFSHLSTQSLYAPPVYGAVATLWRTPSEGLFPTGTESEVSGEGLSVNLTKKYLLGRAPHPELMALPLREWALENEG